MENNQNLPTKSETAILEFAPQGWTRGQIEILKSLVAKGCDDNELMLFSYVCKRTGLDPFARQIYPVKRWSKKENREVMSIQTGIDGFRLVAERSGKYLGQVGPYWCGNDGVWKDVWLAKESPAASKVGVLREGRAEPTWAVANWAGYYQEKNPLWRTLGPVMIAKCAEALALRKCFPQELSGVYTKEEMDQADKEPDFSPKKEEPKTVQAEVVPSHVLEQRAEINGNIKSLIMDMTQNGQDKEMISFLCREFNIEKLGKIFEIPWDKREEALGRLNMIYNDMMEEAENMDHKNVTK